MVNDELLLVPSTTPHCRSRETSSESSHGGSASISVTANPFAVAPTAELQRLADVAARTAVVAIPQDVRTTTATILSPFGATATHTFAAIRIGTRANIAARAAVVGIGIQDAAHAVARHRPLDATVETGASDALTNLKGTRFCTTEAAAPAVVEIVFEIGAVGSATRFAVGAAVVATGPAVWVGFQIGARSITNRSRAADILAA